MMEFLYLHHLYGALQQYSGMVFALLGGPDFLICFFNMGRGGLSDKRKTAARKPGRRRCDVRHQQLLCGPSPEDSGLNMLAG
jgi:hypothetical protein